MSEKKPRACDRCGETLGDDKHTVTLHADIKKSRGLWRYEADRHELCAECFKAAQEMYGRWVSGEDA